MEATPVPQKVVDRVFRLPEKRAEAPPPIQLTVEDVLNADPQAGGIVDIEALLGEIHLGEDDSSVLAHMDKDPPLPSFSEVIASSGNTPEQRELPALLAPQESLELELQKPPAEIFDDFLAALAQPNEELVADSQESAPSAEADITVQTPAAFAGFVEKLKTLDSETRETAVEAVRTIVEVVYKLHTLYESENPDIEQIADAVERLTEYCADLFKIADVPCDEETLVQFIEHILQAEFAQSMTQPQVLDIEHAGTHEIKRYFSQIFSTYAQTSGKTSLQHTLGKVTVLCTNLAARRQDIFPSIRRQNLAQAA